MRVLINDKQNLLSELAIQQTEAKVAAAFSKFGFRISRIEIFLRDINGPRGGADMECRVVAKIKKMGEVVVTVCDQSLTRSISHAITRTERSVARRIQKTSASEQGRRSNFGLAFHNR